jgi:transcriptional regulator with XRE-family HTH domain
VHTAEDDEATLREAGERIRQARRERGLTQESLAAAVGVSRSAVAQWETGRSGQVRGNIAGIARALQVDVEFLLYGSRLHDPLKAVGADELALLRLYRACLPHARQTLLLTAHRLAHNPPNEDPEVKSK